METEGTYVDEGCGPGEEDLVEKADTCIRRLPFEERILFLVLDLCLLTVIVLQRVIIVIFFFLLDKQRHLLVSHY